MTEYYGRFAPYPLDSHSAREMRALFENGELHPDYLLSGFIELDTHTADADAVLLEIKAALDNEEFRRERLRAVDRAD